MAKNYKRHSTGGRFKKADIGDAGIRSLKEQQRDIIQSIKVRAEQDKEISSQQISGFDRKSSKELENRQVLKNLENDIFKNKTKNIKVRAGNEIDRLEGKAKELGKLSDFWKNWSTTYSRQLLQAAQQTIDFKDRLWADKQQDFFIDQYPNLIDFDADNFKEGAYKTLDENLRAALNKTIASEDPKVSKEAKEEAKTILRLMSRTNRFLDARKVAQIKEDINSFEKNLKQTILNDIQNNPDSKLKWNAATMEGHYRQAAKNLIVEFGIRPNSKEARELISLFTSKGVAASTKQNLVDEAIKDEELNLEKLDEIHAANNLTRPEAVYQYVGSVKVSTIKLPDGKYREDEPNFAIARIDAATLSASSFKTADSFVNAFQNMLVENTKGDLNAPKVSWLERNSKPKRQAEDEELLRKIWAEAHKDRITQDNNNKIIESAEGVKAIEDYIALDTTDLTTEEGQKGLRELETKYAMHEKPNNLLKTLNTFDFENKNISYLNADIVKAWSEGKPEEFFQIYNSSNTETKKRFNKLRKDMDALTSASGYVKGKGITDWAEARIYGVNGITSVYSVDKDLLEPQVIAYESAFYKKFHELGEDGTLKPSQRWNQAKQYVDGLLIEKNDDGTIGAGVFRRQGEGGKTTWLAFTKEEDLNSEYTAADLDLALNKSPSAINTTIDNLINLHLSDDNPKRIVSQDIKDNLLISIDAGETVAIPYAIQKLFNSQVGPKEKWKYKTPRELAEKVFEIKIPEGTFERNEFIDKQSPLRVPKLNDYSQLEQAYINAVRQEAVDKWPKSEELQQKIEAYGGFDMIDLDDINPYKFLDNPDRDWAKYYRIP